MKTALVTGASRGVGRGVAISLAIAGYRVYATGRTVERAELPAEVIRISCDHTDDSQTQAVFDRIAADAVGLDLVVNSAWGGYECVIDKGEFAWALPFWEQTEKRWATMIDAGVRAAFVVSAQAARLMIEARAGLIVNISYWAAQKYLGNTVYGVAKAATDKLTADMASELNGFGVHAISLYPGLVRTEAVLQAAESGAFDLSNSESPEFIGRVIAAVAADPKLATRSGQVLVAAAVARELGVRDIDGKQPEPLTLDVV